PRVAQATPHPPAGTLPGPRGHDRTGADVEAALGGRGPARAAAARGRDPSGTGGAADAGDRGGAEVLGGDGAGAPPPRAHHAQEDDGRDLIWGQSGTGADLAAVEEAAIGDRLELLEQYRVVEQLDLLEEFDVIRDLDRLTVERTG